MGIEFKSYKSLIFFFSFIFIITCPGCSDDIEDPGYHPVITGFTLDPTEAEEVSGQRVAVSATVTYTDKDYYLDRGVCEVVCSVEQGGSQVYFLDDLLQGGAQTASGSYTFSYLADISSPTFYWFEMYVVDKTGRESNLVGGYFTVTEAEEATP